MNDSSTWAGLRFFKMTSNLYPSSRLQNSPYNFGKDNLLMHGKMVSHFILILRLAASFIKTLHNSASEDRILFVSGFRVLELRPML